MLLAVLLPVGVVASAAANGASGGIGPAVLKCMHFKDGMTLTPGLTNSSPSNQTVKAHGRMYGCNKAGGSAKFTAQLHMTHATCADLSMAGSNRFDWANGRTSTAFLTFTPQVVEPNKVFITGVIGNGLFKGLIVQAWVRFTQVFAGKGPGCTAANPLKNINFTNTQSYQLLTPPTSTTTVPQHPTTTTEPESSTTRATTPSTTAPPTSTSAPTTSSTTTPTTTAPTSTAASTSTTVPISVAGSTDAPTTAAAGPIDQTTAPGGGGAAVVVNRTGALAFTGSNSLGAILGLESLIVGGALACFGRDRRARRMQFAPQTGAKSWLHVTLPPKQ